jgi:hypothetical protein
MESLRVLLQARQLLSHDAAEQSKLKAIFVVQYII